MIPDTLKNKDINFVLLEKGGKKPFQKDWQKKTIKFDDVELISHINSGGNYGVMGGGERNLIIIDFDSELLQNKLIDKLPKTFMVKTGGGLLHLYYFSNNAKSFKIFDEEVNTLADIQGEGKQVVGAGSIHPNGSPYEIVKDIPITFIDFSEIQANLLPYDKKPKREEIKKPIPKKQLEDNDFMDLLTSTVKVPEVLSSLGVDTSKNPTECPFHSSKGGKCLGFTDETWHCFHCEEKGNIISLIKMDRNFGAKEAIEELAKIGRIEDKLEESRKEYNNSLKKASQSFTRKGQADNFNAIQPLFYDRAGMFWLWNDEEFYWEISDDVDVLNMISDSTSQDIINSKNRTEILNSLKQNGRLKIPKPIKKTWIQFKEIIFDISTGESFKSTPEYFVTNPLPYKLHSDKFEDTPTMDRIFEEWVGKDYVRTLYEILAYCMIPDYPIQRIFCFIGSGMNGKSKFLELLEKFIGVKNMCTTELDTLMNSRFEITKLHKKLVCQMGETNFNEMSRTSKLKKLTGGDLIGFEYKNKNPFEAKNYAKILIATNSLPTTSDKTIGFYRRWMIIDFPNQFSEKKDILKEIPEEEYESLSLKCTTILSDLLKKREFHREGSPEDRMRTYEAKADFLQDFLEAFVEKDGRGYITKADFSKKFSSWCKENRHREMADSTLGRKMKEKEFESVRRSFDWLNDGKGGKIFIWEGVQWKE